MSTRSLLSQLPDWFVAGVVYVAVLSVYLLSGTVFINRPIVPTLAKAAAPGVQDDFLGPDCFSVNDSSAVIAQSLSLLRDGDLSFRPVEIPHMVHWKIAGASDADAFDLPVIDDRLKAWIDAGTIVPTKERFHQIIPCTEPNTYLSCFGIGAPLTAAPAFAVARLWFGPLDERPDLLDRIAFAEGSSLVAASCLFLYFALRRQLTRRHTVLLVLAYGLGTCVFSTSSQGLWQHSSSAFFLSLGLFALSRTDVRPTTDVALGACLGMATLSRPTLAIVALAIGVHLLVTDRKRLVLYVLGGVPFAAALAAYNAHYLGSPVHFGQTVLAEVAVRKTGEGSIWQTPVLTGLCGLLISPSRGLFVYSPFLLGSVLGGILAWRKTAWTWVRPFTIALPAILLVESRHFDWWGGWSYGYRHLVDLTPMLVILIAPAANYLFSRGFVPLLFQLSIVWSLAVQFLGVTANDGWGWNDRAGYVLFDSHGKEVRRTFDPEILREWVAVPGRRAEAVFLNIDDTRNRSRLWSISDSQIPYYLRNFQSGVAFRQSQMWNARRSYSRRLAESYRHLGLAYRKVHAVDTASACLQWSLQADPSFQEAILALWEIHAEMKSSPEKIFAVLQARAARQPDDLATLIYLGLLFVELGDTAKAVQALEEVLRRDPSEFERRFESGSRYLRQRIKAGAVFRAGPEVGSRLAAVTSIMDAYKRARAAESNGDLLAAERAYRDVNLLFPSIPTTRVHLARILLRQGRPAESLSLLRAEGRGTPTN